MTGPEHYREAERLLAESVHLDTARQVRPHLVKRANVHAKLAQAAATAMSQRGEMPIADYEAWGEVAGTVRSATAGPAVAEDVADDDPRGWQG